MDTSGDIDGEVTRIDAVRYLQGAVGHAVGSILFLFVGGLFWLFEYGIIAFTSILAAFLLSANGLSIWAWDRLRSYFAVRTTPSAEAGSDRELTPSPLPPESRVEIKAGGTMTLAFVLLLVLGRVGLQFLGARAFGYLRVGILFAGNIAALATSLRGPSD